LYFAGGTYEVSLDINETQVGVKTCYAIGGQSIAMEDGSGLKYFLTDNLGSFSAVVSADGNLLSEQRYIIPFGDLPFGEPRDDPGITQTDFGYTGQRGLTDGLMDYHARFYDVYLNHFTQPDTIIPSLTNPQTLNRYSYVANNPINRSDPSGHKCTPEDDCLTPHGGTPSVDAPIPADPDAKKSGDKTLEGVATVLDTAAALENGVYAITGDLVGLVCTFCYPYVVSFYQVYSYIPNITSTISMVLWGIDGYETGENNYSAINISGNTYVSASVSQDTIVAVGTNLAGWNILKEPNAAFAVDAGVAVYDYGRSGNLPFKITIPAWINPTFSYNTNSGFKFTW
jgi:RHS repeat-associated protein